MFAPKVKMDRDLLKRVRQFAEAAGYASVEEFVAHAVEKAMAQCGETDADTHHQAEELKKRLQGLGYLS